MPLSTSALYAGEPFRIPSGLHNANPFARAQVCKSENDANRGFYENANMRKSKKKTANQAPANHLRAWREFRKLTQEQLADAVGTDKSVISLLENSERGLSHKWANRLAVPLKTTPGYLLDHNPEDLPTQFIDLWNDIPDESKPQALEILETFRKRA